MRKLKLQVQISIDGFISGPQHELDWMTFPWTGDIESYVDQITAPVDTIVLGRKLAEGFIPHWGAIAANESHPEYMAGRKFTDTLKVVFSKTIQQPKWDNTVIKSGDLQTEILKLKRKSGKDIIAYGGATFVSGLIQADLIDEYHLFVNTAALGTGMPIFKSIKNLKLKDAKRFDCGIVVLVYTR